LTERFGVVDLFAGPGGLGEGFASLAVKGRRPFKIGISVEREPSAHSTLTLRAFVRAYVQRFGSLPAEYVAFHAGLIGEPDWASIDQGLWEMAIGEARFLTLGSESAASAVDEAIKNLQDTCDDTILIGGPPCQAYSLVGRARTKGIRDYVPEADERHYLFREYIRVLKKLRPAAFVMENVKGILSSTVESRLVFDMLMEDLASEGLRRGEVYNLKCIHVENGRASLMTPKTPSDFIVRSEEFGLPQRRHRVIIIGLRKDISGNADSKSILVPKARYTVSDAISGMPEIRSGLSRERDDPKRWQSVLVAAAKELASVGHRSADDSLARSFEQLAQALRSQAPLGRRGIDLGESYGVRHDPLSRWIETPGLIGLANHDSRSHMASDLRRYLFSTVFASHQNRSPLASDFPRELWPNHRSWQGGAFNDRFRVQIGHESGSTITSHISKDGHAFIHPDSRQCRSFTVREAARIQTFPDDYLFMGNRTQQYVQVGNAVPPFLALQIARLLNVVLGPINV
jgi:DNA (cytosine-5)-methyltransferase 1